MRDYFREAKVTLILAVPIMLSQIGQMLMGVTDTAMVGRLGAIPLGAGAFANSIFQIFLIFGFGVLSPISALIAQSHGRGEKRHCGELTRHSHYLAFIFATLMALIVQALSRELHHFGQSPEIVAEARNYLVLIGWSMVPALLFHSLRQSSEGLGATKTPMVVMILAIFLNIFFNWLLIYGHWGFPALGLVGSGIATLSVRILMFIVLAIYVSSAAHFRDFLPEKIFHTLDSKIFKNIFRLGIASAFQYLFEVGAFSMAAIMMGWIGTKQIAAHQIALSLASMTFMISLGISIAVSIRVGKAIGSNHRAIARRVSLSGIFSAAILMGFFGVIFILFRTPLAALYISDPVVVAIAAQLLIIGGLFQVVDGAQCVAVGALRGMLDVHIPTLITFFAYWGVSLPLGYLLAFNAGYGANGIWAGLGIGLAISAILLTARVLRTSAVKA